MTRAAALLALVLSSGCVFESVRYKTHPPNPWPDLKTVAVLPFLNRTLDPQSNFVEFATIFANELVKFDGFRALRPLQVAEAAQPGEKLRTLEDVLRLARRLKADAVIVADVTDFDPYEPPRIGISVQFLRTSARLLSSREIDSIVQSASWRRGPLALAPDRAGHLIASFERVYDAHEEGTRKEVLAYAQAQDETDSPFPGEREFLAVQPRYQQFVANHVIRRLLEPAPPNVP